jgi:hypothetical protein
LCIVIASNPEFSCQFLTFNWIDSVPAFAMTCCYNSVITHGYKDIGATRLLAKRNSFTCGHEEVDKKNQVELSLKVGIKICISPLIIK